jgi:hypothetical protein
MKNTTFAGHYKTFMQCKSANHLTSSGYHSKDSKNSIIALAKYRLSCSKEGVLPKPNWGNCRESIISTALLMLNKPLLVLDIGGALALCTLV